VLKWSRRCFLGLLFLIVVAWAVAEGSQWLLRYQGERLLADVRAIQIGRSSESDAKAALRKWGRWGRTSSGCDGYKCYSFVVIGNVYDLALRGDFEGDRRHLLAKALDGLGLRPESVGANITTVRGIVTSKAFADDVGLPMRDWFLRGSAYVPDLSIWSGESSELSSRDKRYAGTTHPFRAAHFAKGPYGLRVTFAPEEDGAEQAALMNFQFECMTRFTPCRSEGDILPEGWRLMQEEEGESAK